MTEFDVWRARFSENLIQQIKEKFRTDVPKQHILCFYLLMASMGVLQIHDHEQIEWSSKNPEKIRKLTLSKNYFMGLQFIEAFSENMIIEGNIMPERLPVMNKNGTLDGFLDQQYLLLTTFSPIIDWYMPREVAALEFLE